MDELVQWYGEQLDEDERLLRAGLDAAVPPSGHVMQDRVVFGGLDRGVPEPIMDCYVQFGDPKRVLREIDAKRRILAEHTLNGWVCSTCDDEEDIDQRFPCPTLRLLALPYSDRPGYKAEEWVP